MRSAGPAMPRGRPAGRPASSGGASSRRSASTTSWYSRGALIDEDRQHGHTILPGVAFSSRLRRSRRSPRSWMCAVSLTRWSCWKKSPGAGPASASPRHAAAATSRTTALARTLMPGRVSADRRERQPLKEAPPSTETARMPHGELRVVLEWLGLVEPDRSRREPIARAEVGAMAGVPAPRDCRGSRGARGQRPPRLVRLKRSPIRSPDPTAASRT